MKHLLTIALLGVTLILVLTRAKPRGIPMWGTADAQYWTTGGPNPDEIAYGEYYGLALRHDSIFDITQGIPVYLAKNAIHVFAGAHNAGYIDANHRAWTEGDNAAGNMGTNNSGSGTYGLAMISTDSLGNQVYFSDVQYGENNAVSNGSYWWAAGVSYTDSSLYAWGDLYGGNCGNGTKCALRSQAPVKIPLPAGEKVVSIKVGYFILALCASGHVYTIGGGGGGITNNTVGQGGSPDFYDPVLLNFSGKSIRLIAGGGLWSYAVTTDGQLWNWGSDFHLYYQTYAYGTSASSTPRNITANVSFSPSAITEMAANNDATYVIAGGILYDWGGTGQGALGNGYATDMKRYGGYPLPYGTSNPFPYAWAQDYNEGNASFPTSIPYTIQLAPVNPTQGVTNYLHIYAQACGYSYHAYFMLADGRICFCGRNKAELCNGILPWDYTEGPTQSRYPNAWDRKDMTMINIFAQSTLYYSPSPDCKSDGTKLWSDACSLYSPGTVTFPTASLSVSTASVGGHWAIILDNSASYDAQIIMKRPMYQASGPHTLYFGIRDQAKDTILMADNGYLTPGDTYGIFANIVNNNFDSTHSSTVSVTIPSTTGCANCITLPVNVKFH